MDYIEITKQEELDEALASGKRVHLVGNNHFIVNGRADVVLRGNAHAELRDNAHAVLWDNAHAVLWDNAHAVLWDNAHAELWDNAHAVLWGNAHAVLWGNAHAVAGTRAVLGIRSRDATAVGGIRVPHNPPTTYQEWCGVYLVKCVGTTATLYKAVNDQYHSPYGGTYLPGTCPEAPDWDGGAEECGGGLHFSPTPRMALAYNSTATKFVACPVDLSTVVFHADAQYPDKVKAPRCAGPVWEVDIDGNRIVPQ